jgi:hypothetical protein
MNYIKRDIEAVDQGSGFETIEELLEVDFIKRYSQMSHFDKFVINKEHKTIMVIWKDGSYDNIGFLEDITDVDLPEWKPVSNYFGLSD